MASDLTDSFARDLPHFTSQNFGATAAIQFILGPTAITATRPRGSPAPKFFHLRRHRARGGRPKYFSQSTPAAVPQSFPATGTSRQLRCKGRGWASAGFGGLMSAYVLGDTLRHVGLREVQTSLGQVRNFGTHARVVTIVNMLHSSIEES